MNKFRILFLALSSLFFYASCNEEDNQPTEQVSEWKRASQNPVFRDLIVEENYQSASDPHVFFDEEGSLQMIYSGDVDGSSSIKLASGSSWYEWTQNTPLLSAIGPSGLDKHKETAFYRKASNGKHQIYYIGYNDENTYEAQIFLAEADELMGPYTQQSQAVVTKGNIASKEVYCMTSPSVVEHKGLLYMTFLGWNASPEEVTEVWVMGATSTDQGHTWTDFQTVDTRIGMEGQLTKTTDGRFIAVRTGEYEDVEAIFYATSTHPFGPSTEHELPILMNEGPPYEKDEIIAPQIIIDPNTEKEYLYYTGADYQVGWWVMLAEKE